MNILQDFIRPNQFTRPGLPLRRVTAIAIHYTGDPGATAQNERNYFNGSCISDGRYASCHFVVGMDGEIIQLIPESEWAYCTCQANSYSLSIETCHQDSTGKFTEAAEKALIELTASLCRKYGLDPLHGGIVRHYDVTGKVCPKYYVDNPGLWTQFKQAVSNCMTGKPYSLPCSGAVIAAAVHVDPNYCDTGSLTQCPGMVYTFKTGSPISCAGGSNAPFAQIAHSMDGGYHLTTFKAVKETASVGFYANGKRVCIGVVKQPHCDTGNFTKKTGQTYQFKTDFPISSANSNIFQQESSVYKRGYYFTKFRAVGKGSAGFYCGSTVVCVGTVI